MTTPQHPPADEQAVRRVEELLERSSLGTEGAQALRRHRPTSAERRALERIVVETHTFDQGAPGYLPAHVDLFLARAARALAGRDMAEQLTRWDVLRQRFPLAPRGYSTSEVDAFLVRLAAQFPDPDPAAAQHEILHKLEEG